ncbi:NAD(P)H-dependent glycerol-3-phosphate dehydrogenase [Salisaeta longa]|uniref:NAD(P)H-dependent glycerol-3-phosphate dehydrogenase n=1 Tax=Salisaeta longa TaxID=503170 RepID=UPI0003B635FB|nr:NAD(P)H-dependent glycerol-3-phosphate dehydrogenase [Salisaeta longa]
MNAPITILGAGSWGTALAVHWARAGRDVTLWTRRPAAAASMRHTRHNPRYLPDVALPAGVTVTSSLASAAEASSLWALAVPSQAMRALVRQLIPFLHPAVHLVSLAKGIENGTLCTMSQVIADVLGPAVDHRVSVCYGPSHAEEVALDQPTAVVVAAPHLDTAETIQARFMTDRLRVYVNTDVMGVEVGGSAKNVLAIAAGISDGVGYGDNAKAALVTRGLAEIKRLGLALGAKPATFAGLTGIGDLVVTCMSAHSRNRHLGEQIGRGHALASIVDRMDMVAEGVQTTVSLRDLAARHGIEMPITAAVYAVLFEGQAPEAMVDALMTRDAKRENWRPELLES